VLEEVIGSGGFGTTWRARAGVDDVGSSLAGDLGLSAGQLVALKLVKLEDGWDSLQRFEREVSVLRRLDHPRIPKYFGTVLRDRANGRDYGIVSTLVNGTSLDLLVQDGRWSAGASAIRNLAESLLEVAAHLATFAPPIVHRDIKPANIVLEPDGSGWKAFLVDFGAAVLGGGTKTTSVGTFGFMAPETFGQVVSPKSDLYGIGASLLFAATGREPSSFPQNRLRLQYRDAFVGTVWEREEAWLAELLDGLLAPAPEDRFSSATEALRFLRGGSSRPAGAVAALAAPFAAAAAALAAKRRERGAGVEPPRGSTVKVQRTGFDLKVLLPPPSLMNALPVGSFAVVWTAFVGFWTAGVLSAGAPIMALFSVPFWGVGGSLLKESFGPWLRGASELTIGRQRWSYGRIGAKDSTMEGRTADLKCGLETNMVVNGNEKKSISLSEGVLKQQLAEGLQEEEQAWLAEFIQEHLERCNAPPGDPEVGMLEA